MIKKLVFLLLLTTYSANSSAGTLFIDLKRRHHHLIEYITQLFVSDYGWNSAGIFVVRFEDGRPELYLGRRSDYEYFDYHYVDHNELYKYK